MRAAAITTALLAATILASLAACGLVAHLGWPS